MFDQPVSAMETTYRPSHHEAGWLLQSLGPWLDDGTLSDVLFAVRGGKEANVYAARGGPGTGDALIAAKVYRPRKHRELSNDAIYREGRGLIDGFGHAVRARDRRMRRAVQRGTRRGKATTHASWVRHEFAALSRLRQAGADVPEPIAVSNNAVLMSFVGDVRGAAPTLQGHGPAPALARRWLHDVLRNVEILLSCGIVHGDLSPYNLLVDGERLVLIDLPQAVDVLNNPHAIRLYLRDVQRICEAKALGRPVSDWRAVADAIWDRVFDTDTGVPDSPVAQAPPPMPWPDPIG